MSEFAYCAELELVIAGCSFTDSAVSVREVSTCLEKPLDWQRVLGLADHHNVVPVLYQTLRRVAGLVPPVVLQELRGAYEWNARRNLKFVAELFRVLDCLEAHAIEAIPLKGPALAEAAYGDGSARCYSDLDVLIRPEDVMRAKAALKTIGYATALHLSNPAEQAYLATGYEYGFDGPAGRNVLEIQWAILPRIYAIDFHCRELFERSGMATVSDRSVHALSGEDLLLVLCVHAAKHAWIRLSWLCDIAAVLRTAALDWSVVQQRAQALGILRMVGVSLMLAESLAGAPIPDPARRLARADAESERIAQKIQWHLPRAEYYSVESLQYFWLMLRLRERRRDQVRFVFRMVFTPSLSEWQVVRLPGGLFWLYRVIRILRLAGRILTLGFRFRSANRTHEGHQA